MRIGNNKNMSIVVARFDEQYILFNKKKGLLLGYEKDDCPLCNGTGKRSNRTTIPMDRNVIDFIVDWQEKPEWKYWHKQYLIKERLAEEQADDAIRQIESEMEGAPAR
jgi:hypothetical protein